MTANQRALGTEEDFARKAEIRQCIDEGGTCAQSGMRPPHFAAAKCESNGRRWDAETKTFVGYAHCSCDACF